MLTSDEMHDVQGMLAAAQSNLDRLRHIKPCLIDLSLRETAVGAPVGQTLSSKLELLPRLRAFGFSNILLGTLNYAMPEELEVDDDFMIHLRDAGADMTGCYASTSMGLVEGGVFRPDPSMCKLRDYRVPNTIHEIYLSEEGMKGQYDWPTLYSSLPASIQWLVENVRGDKGAAPRIMLNIVDGCDALTENPEGVCSFLKWLSELSYSLPVEGVSIEDGRGTYLPFQVGTCVALARRFLPPPLTLLVHVHAGAGVENASVIEALLNGADGVWGGLPKRAAVNGHASLGELIANLTRVGNAHMREYRLDVLLPLTSSLQVIEGEQDTADDLPIFGRNAYRLPLSFFQQKSERFMDLAPEAIGGQYRYRICPVVSDPAVIAGRLAEVTGRPAQSFSGDVLQQMVRLMRRDLRAGIAVEYDLPQNLITLLQRVSSDQ